MFSASPTLFAAQCRTPTLEAIRITLSLGIAAILLGDRISGSQLILDETKWSLQRGDHCLHLALVQGGEAGTGVYNMMAKILSALVSQRQ